MQVTDLADLQHPVIFFVIARGKRECGPVRVVGIDKPMKRQMEDVEIGKRQRFEMRLRRVTSKEDRARFGEIGRDGLDLLPAFRKGLKICIAGPGKRAKYGVLVRGAV